MDIAPFRLERYFAAHEFTVDYLLCASDCESVCVGDLLALEADARERFENQWLGYTNASGGFELRREVCRLYATIDPDQVLVHSGAEEAIFLFMHAVLAAGDHVIVHWPCYQSLAEIPRSIGCRVDLWRARAERGWALDTDDLRRLLRPDTRAVVLNLPHNPTGYLMPAAQFEEVNRIARENGTVLLCDEVYRESEYQETERLPAACDLGAHAVSLGVVSKTYGLAGLRIGWVATHNAAVLSKMAALKDYTTICNSAPGEFLAALALRHRESLAARNLQVIRQNLDVLDDFFGRHEDWFEWRRPIAGPVAFPFLKGRDAASFCRELAEQRRVLLLPGSLFGIEGNHVRFGFGRRNLPEAVERLEEFVLSQKHRPA